MGLFIQKFSADRALINGAVMAAETGSDVPVLRVLATPGYKPHWKIATEALAEGLHRSSPYAYPGISRNVIDALCNAGARAVHRGKVHGWSDHVYEEPMYRAMHASGTHVDHEVKGNYVAWLAARGDVSPSILRFYMQNSDESLLRPDSMAKMIDILDATEAIYGERMIMLPFGLKMPVGGEVRFNFTAALINISLDNAVNLPIGSVSVGFGGKNPQKSSAMTSLMDFALMRAVEMAAKTGSVSYIKTALLYPGYKPSEDRLTAALSHGLRLSRHPGYQGLSVEAVEGLHAMGAHLDRDVRIGGNVYVAPVKEAAYLADRPEKVPYMAYMAGRVSVEDIDVALEGARHVIRPFVARSLQKHAQFEAGRIAP